MQVLEEFAVFTIGTDKWIWQIIIDLKKILLFKPPTLFVYLNISYNGKKKEETP
jgi:hypothetical protein